MKETPATDAEEQKMKAENLHWPTIVRACAFARRLEAALRAAEEALTVASIDYSGRRDAYDKGRSGWLINGALAIRMDEAREIIRAAAPPPDRGRRGRGTDL